jgi:hypothetical protein
MPKAADGPKWSPQVVHGYELDRGSIQPPGTDRWKDELGKVESKRKKDIRRQRAERLSKSRENSN